MFYHGFWTWWISWTLHSPYFAKLTTQLLQHGNSCCCMYFSETPGINLQWISVLHWISVLLQSHRSSCRCDSLILRCLFSLCPLFLKDKCISSLFRTKYIEKKFNLQLFFLPTVSRTFILSWATTRYPPPWNFLFRKNNCMCNRDNARDVAACPDE